MKKRSINENEWERDWLKELDPVPDSENFGELWLKVADEMGINILTIEEDKNDD
tara:strand:+ start:966 stop:1127 length:162 start_codon:yes stop_codon:yes gene_type:complete